MLSVIMLSVIMLSVIMLSVIMLSVIMLSVIMLKVVMLIVVAPSNGNKLEISKTFHQKFYKTFLFLTYAYK
jgi:hypothetical protein